MASGIPKYLPNSQCSDQVVLKSPSDVNHHYLVERTVYIAKIGLLTLGRGNMGTGIGIE